MNWLDQLNYINEEYYKVDGENKHIVIDAIKKIHMAVFKNPEELTKFTQVVKDMAGGCYIPYLFWLELSRFIDAKNNSAMIFKLLEAFVNSDFEDEEKSRMKPLLVVYYNLERTFEIDKIHTNLLEHAHKSVKEYFQFILKFVQNNRNSVEAYVQKVHLLKKYYPNFDLLELSVQELEEKLKTKS